MKAIVLSSPAPIDTEPLAYTELPVPEPDSGEILVRVVICGICHTDLHTVEGELPLVTKPIVPGHQIIGFVEKVGSGVSSFGVGDRVGMAWLHATCGSCVYCKTGRENLCANAQFTGYHVNGGYAQYTVINEKFAYAIPEVFEDREAAPLLCAGIIGFRALRLSEIKQGQRLALYGFGASAHIAIQIAVFWGCKVFAFTRTSEHRDLAIKLGAVWAGKPTDTPPEKQDSAVIFAPAGEIVPLALGNLDRGGTCALAGIYMTPIPGLDYEKHLYYERTLRSVTASTREDGKDLLSIAAKIPIKPATTVFPLKDANRALQLLKRSSINGAGVLEIP
jgi:propanol-preferring alcohol dehydrogenase